MITAHLDYEARSGVDIRDVGSHRWSIDPRFEILMASVSRDGDDRVYLWVNPAFQTVDLPGDNEEAERILAEADVVYAHNATNEQANTWGAITQGKACPFKREPPMTIWRCTAAMARKAGLPASLEGVSEALNLPVKKDPKGKKLIKLFCMPDEDTGEFVDPRSRPEEWFQFGQYCITDNLAERGVHERLKPFELTGASLATFQFDLRMNQRGIPINVEAARNAQKIIDEVQSGVTAEFRRLTGLNPTQGRKFLPWFNAKFGTSLPNLQAATVETALPTLKPDAAEILGMYQKVSYAAVKKVQTMLDCVCPDGRVRGGHLFYGAGTGRWSGKLLQPQNFKKTPKWMRDIVDEVFKKLCGGGVSVPVLDALYGDPLELISGVIRNFIGVREIFDGDFAQVEARIICWLAGQDDILEKWRRGEDLYKWMAGHVYGIPPELVDADQREVGKRIILGAGFQMGWRTFQRQCMVQYQLDLPKDVCKKGIKMFRRLCTKIRDYWWALNNAALSAIETRQPSGPFSIRKIAGITYLLFRIRSGRSLAYPYPEVKLVKWIPEPDDEEDQPIQDAPKPEPEVKWRKEITYWGQIPGSTQWGRIKLYGGKLAENETQATAADFMSHGAITAEARGMPPFMLVHDQGLSERFGDRTVKDYEEALGALPEWAKGMPLKVEAKIAPYYKK